MNLNSEYIQASLANKPNEFSRACRVVAQLDARCAPDLAVAAFYSTARHPCKCERIMFPDNYFRVLFPPVFVVYNFFFSHVNENCSSSEIGAEEHAFVYVDLKPVKHRFSMY